MEAIERLLAQKRFDEAVFRMECLAADGAVVPAALLAEIPDKLLVKSPALLHAYAEHLSGQGKLAMAKGYAKLAVKSFLEQGLSISFQIACALLASIHARLGDRSEAEVVLFQLEEERRRAEDHTPAAVLSVLAEFGPVIGKPASSCKRLYREAIRLYEREGEHVLASKTAFHMLLADVYAAESGAGEDALADFRAMLEGTGQESSSMDGYAAILDCAYAGRSRQWALVLEKAETVSGLAELDYFHAAFVQFLVLQAELRSGCADSGKSRLLLADWEKYRSDIRLQWLIACAHLESCLTARDSRQTKRWLERINALRSGGSVSELLERLAASLEREADMRLHEDEKTGRPPKAWKVQCFDGFSFFREGQDVRRLVWKRKKAQELFLYLLLQPNYTAPKDQVASVLFRGDENGGEKVSNQIYVCVHQIRQTAERFLGLKQAVVVKDGVIRLNEADFDYVDVEKYRTLVKVGGNLWNAGEQELAVELMEEASQLYGELLPAALNADWLDLMREQLLDDQEGLLQKLWEAAYGGKQYDRAESVAKAWLRLSPYKEQAFHAMIRSVRALGRKSEAREWYDRLESMLRTEYGILPDSELRNKLLG
ncbi:BTAD domain-containing putative transcriptional regulator [Paenibacillus sp. MBLB4367]|uniref:AfsR/SARP family transcriptional regulator n=1 Tax=Paenibacillus sp. MBLB4367 TaxID=3384767 RepID=UPI003907F961